MSGGNANTTISWPGPGWTMLWDNGGFDNFQLDIVGFLAVLGEGSVLANSQVSALSPLFYLPRIIPAPQALLPPTRPRTLPSTPASVTGVFSGNTKDRVYHVANILLAGELDTYEVRCVEVTKHTTKGSMQMAKQSLKQDRKQDSKQDLKQGPKPRLRRSKPMRLVEWMVAKTDTESTPLVTAATKGPLSWVTVLGCLLSTGLFISSITFGDGMSLIATILLSFLSTLTGIANKWKLKLPRRVPHDAPPGDTVVRYPNGSYLIVRCDEEVARELYFAPEEIKYQISNQSLYRVISLVGTIILMFGIIALANAKLQLQFAWAGAYLIINAAHWVVAALPQRLHWDLSCYELREQGVEGGPHSKNFTEALWKAILLTKDIRWVKNGNAAPQTSVWDEWLIEADRQARCGGMIMGKLEDPDRRLGYPQPKATIWKAPPGWHPKAAWNRINVEHEGVKVQGAAPALQ